ncbi:MAG: alpha/beta fold hydrolase [Candidatus Competibacteraceae bacterium]
MTRFYRIGALVGVMLAILCQTALASSLYDIYYHINNLFIQGSKHGTAVRINYRKWFDPNAVAVIVYVHGIESHSQWFNEAGDYLASRGYNVYAPDRRGSGLSDGQRGHIQNSFQWLDDLDKMIDLAHRENPNKPIHLLANSFGARIAIGYAIDHPSKISSLILSGPGTHMQLSLPPELLNTVITGYWEYLPIPIEDALFTDDPEKQAFMAQDQLKLKEVTANLYKMGELLNVVNLTPPNLKRLTIPVLVLLATEDKIIDPAGVISGFYNRLQTNKKLVTYDHVEHFLFFEEVAPDVFNEIIAWTQALNL